MLTKYVPFLSAGIQLLKGRIANRPFPWYVNLFITNKCNLRCPYCYIVTNRHGITGLSHKTLQEPTFQEIINNIDELYDLGTRYVCLLGGEPLIREDLPEIVAHIKKKNMLVGLNSNGVLLSQHLDVLKEVNRLTISLEGDEEMHDQDRGEGSYQEILKNIRICGENGINKIGIQMTVTGTTRDSWEHVVCLAKDIGATVLITEISNRPGEEAELENLSKEETASLWSRIYDLKKQGYPIENTYEAISNVIKYNDYIGPFNIIESYKKLPEKLREFVKANKCSQGRYNAFLDTDGTVYPCVSMFGIKGYNTKELTLSKSFEKMASNNSCSGSEENSDSCKCCRTFLNSQTSYLFSSFNPVTLGRLAYQALTKYRY
jgi:radical SAM protein with 4Fe4S-binding SPASM domain